MKFSPFNPLQCASNGVTSGSIKLTTNSLKSQLLSTLSAFDILGSCAYALTTLPTPKSDMLYGAQGNELTCTTQAFFIQIGTIACLLNVSLAMYFLLMNKYQWTEDRLKSKHCRFFLFFPPIFIGLLFAFVGIPFYEEVKVWCNNSEKQVHSSVIDLSMICM